MSDLIRVLLEYCEPGMVIWVPRKSLKISPNCTQVLGLDLYVQVHRVGVVVGYDTLSTTGSSELKTFGEDEGTGTLRTG